MDLELQTTLTPDEVVSALRKSCPAENWFFLPQEKDVIFLFYDKKDRMYLHPVLWMRNAFRKDLYITLTENENGTLITLTGRINGMVRWMCGIWFALVAIFFLAALFAGMFFILIPLASMALLAWFFIFIMRRFAGKEEPEIKDAVTRLFDGLEGK